MLGLAIREETKEAGCITEVVYKPLSHGSLLEDREEKFWTRILEDFNAMVLPETHEDPGNMFRRPEDTPPLSYGANSLPVPRFKKID